MNKYKCSCGETWFAEDYDEAEECYMSDENSNKKHKVSKTKKLTSEDYAELWSRDFENANYHSQTELPEQLRKIILKIIKNETIVLKIMKICYEKGIGI